MLSAMFNAHPILFLIGLAIVFDGINCILKTVFKYLNGEEQEVHDIH